MGREGTVLLEVIDQYARTYISEKPKAYRLVQWAGQITQDSTSDYVHFIKKAAALDSTSANFQSTTDLDKTRDKVSVNTRAIAKARIKDIDISKAKDSAIEISTAKVNAIAIAVAATEVRDRDNAFAETYSGNSFMCIIRDINKAKDAALVRGKNVFITRAISDSIDRASDDINYLNKLKLLNIKAFKELPEQLQDLNHKAPELSAPAEEWFSYAEEIESIWFNALGLTKEELSLSRTEWSHLVNYLYANELLLSCQKSSIGISRKAWEALEARLLTIDEVEEVSDD